MIKVRLKTNKLINRNNFVTYQQNNFPFVIHSYQI